MIRVANPNTKQSPKVTLTAREIKYGTYSAKLDLMGKTQFRVVKVSK